MSPCAGPPARALREQPNADERVVDGAYQERRQTATSRCDALSIEALGQAGTGRQIELAAVEACARGRGKACSPGSGLVDCQNRSAATTASVPVLIGAMREGDGRTLLAVGAMGPMRPGRCRRSSGYCPTSRRKFGHSRQGRSAASAAAAIRESLLWKLRARFERGRAKSGERCASIALGRQALGKHAKQRVPIGIGKVASAEYHRLAMHHESRRFCYDGIGSVHFQSILARRPGE